MQAKHLDRFRLRHSDLDRFRLTQGELDRILDRALVAGGQRPAPAALLGHSQPARGRLNNLRGDAFDER